MVKCKNFIDEVVSLHSIDWTVVSLVVEETGSYLGLGISTNENDPKFFFDFGEKTVLGNNCSENSRVEKGVHIIEIGL